jgi:hypothetical protein
VIVRDALDAADVPRSRAQELVATGVAHAGFGAGNGALYVVASSRPGGSAHPVLLGVLFGVALWRSTTGMDTAVGVLGPALRDQHDRQARIFLAHIVYGRRLVWMHCLLSRTRSVAVLNDPT